MKTNNTNKYLLKTMLFFRNIVYVVLYYIDLNVLQKKTPIIILCYHSISDGQWRFGVNFKEFKRQIEYLKKSYYFIKLDELFDYLVLEKKIPKPAVVLTFDDGYKDNLQIKDFLKEMSIKPTLFVLSTPRSANRQELDSNSPFLSRNDIFKLTADGWTIGCHSNTHSDLLKLQATQLNNEIVNSKKKLQTELALSIDYFSYPKGKYSQKIVTLVKKAGYKLAVSMDDKYITKQTNPLTLPRIGVDRTHSFSQFKATISPSAILFRHYVKKTFLAKYL